ncbi:MAG: tyrosine-type recombinase/integrase [Actinomycetota bacterium]|nr:tyrosine-type recombinase/integrase [Actinomycetota bacterium]
MPRTTTSEDLTHVRNYLRSWERSLRAQNKRPSTIRTYLLAARQFTDFLDARGMPTDVTRITREHVEAFIEDVLDRRTPATAAQRYGSLRHLWRWLLEEGEIERSPMERTHPPKVPEQPPPVLRLDQLKALLRTCSGNEFEARRDNAIIRLFVDTGMRMSELVGLRLEDIDFDLDVAVVEGKGGRWRSCPFGDKTGLALDRYRRARARHSRAGLPWLWLGARGGFGASGVAQMLRRRGREAGIGPINAHRFRHTFAHRWLSEGGTETGLMHVVGWAKGSRSMLGRYGASAAGERAREEHQRLALGDEL